MGISLIKGNPLPETVQKWIEKHPEATVSGIVYRYENAVNSKIIYLKKTYLIYKSEKIPIENIKVYINKNEEVPAGAVIVVSGTMSEFENVRNPGGFDEKAYHACQHIYYVMKYGKIKRISSDYSIHEELLADIREYLTEIINRIAKEDAPVFQAMLLGVKTDLDKETKTLYQIGGIVHIIAISGLHISMIGLGAFAVLRKTGIGIRASGFAALIIMIEYGNMTGNSVSTLRAVSMFVLNISAQLLGRSYDMPTALAVAAVLVLLESPAYLYNSGFQLSFGAVIGIGIIVPIVQENLRIMHPGIKMFVSSLGVQAITLPMVLYAYGEISVIGIFVNLLVLSTVHIIMANGLAGCMLGVLGVSEQIMGMVMLPGRGLLWIYEKICSLAAEVPYFIWIAGKPEITQIIVYYVILGTMLLLVERINKEEKTKKIISGLILCTGLILGCCCIGFRKEKEMEITCLDVGQGDCIFIKTEEKQNFLIDCGSTDERAVGEYDLIPFLKNKGISYVHGIFISHTDEDHVNGIMELLSAVSENMTAIRIGNVILPEWGIKDENYQQIEKLAKSAKADISYVSAGDVIAADEMIIRVYHPESGSAGLDTNEEGMILGIEYKDFTGLFMGDAGAAVEQKILPYLSDVNFVKVGHHGSGYSTCDEFIEKISPEIAVISCGKDNNYGHPSPETVERLIRNGSRVEYTMKNGAITVYMEDGQIGVERCVDK